jgi:signal-transduction protein with cAMP-binding, CBS, and nucleotidyltransferase domain
MHIQQSDLFWGLNQGFVGRIMSIAQTHSLEPGTVLFRAEHRAEHFYILAKGQVQLRLEPGDRPIYTCSKIGETFGWSSLTQRSVYSAAAVCLAPTVVLRFTSSELCRILEEDAENGLIFFRQLAGALGNRLIAAYNMVSGAG